MANPGDEWTAGEVPLELEPKEVLTPKTLRALIPKDRNRTHWGGCSGRGHEWCGVARHADAWETDLRYKRQAERTGEILRQRLAALAAGEEKP